MAEAREQAEQALLRSGTLNARTADGGATASALTGIGYALLHLADVIKGSRNKYEPPF